MIDTGAKLSGAFGTPNGGEVLILDVFALLLDGSFWGVPGRGLPLS